jgi:hypothetical protein
VLTTIRFGNAAKIRKLPHYNTVAIRGIYQVFYPLTMYCSLRLWPSPTCLASFRNRCCAHRLVLVGTGLGFDMLAGLRCLRQNRHDCLSTQLSSAEPPMDAIFDEHQCTYALNFACRDSLVPGSHKKQHPRKQLQIKSSELQLMPMSRCLLKSLSGSCCAQATKYSSDTFERSAQLPEV